MIATQQLSYSYPSGKELIFPDVACSKGEALLITGQSGCGKTTLLHLMGGLLAPTNGQIHIADKNLSALTATERDAFRGKNIGIIFQKMHFIASLNVAQNLELAGWLANIQTSAARMMDLLNELGIADQLHKLPSQLSSGQLQRLAIARAFYNNPQLILADEPTASLDDHNTESVIQLLMHAAKKYQTTLVIVTHDQRLKNYFPNQLSLK
jgi:lipoprotein-releasing system ATP-binding protein